jgi:hypothetical protein
MMGIIMDFFKFMTDWGIWDIIGLIVALVPSVLVIIYLFPRKAIQNFYIDTKIASVNPTYPKVVAVELRNHTNDPIYITSQGFKFGDTIEPSPHGAKDAATGVYEIKFEGRQAGILSEIDILVRPNQVVSTWIPVDPAVSDQSLSNGLRNRTVGILRLKCQRISSRPYRFTKLKILV